MKSLRFRKLAFILLGFFSLILVWIQNFMRVLYVEFTQGFTYGKTGG